MNPTHLGSAALIAMVALAVWFAVSLQRARYRRQLSEIGVAARDALTRFADRALELETVHEILAHTKETAWRLFGC